MLAEIITIGDEILIGQIIDTNSAWLGQQLSLLGIKVNKISSLSSFSYGILPSGTNPSTYITSNHLDYY